MTASVESITNDPGSLSAPNRRNFLFIATGAVAVIGGAALAWPFIDQMNPAADAISLSTVELDLSAMELGQRITVRWQGKPVFIERRTQATIDRVRSENYALLKDPEPDEDRVLDPEWFVAIGICTHLGCIPLGQQKGSRVGDWGGWFCPCHGSHYDQSGRIRRGPAPRNLDIPPYRFIGEAQIRIGERSDRQVAGDKPAGAASA